MKLEDEIKQTRPFRNELHKLLVNIQFTSSWLNSILQQRLKPFDLSPHQFNVLRILKGRYPDVYSNQEITSRMIDRSSNATRIVDKLVDKKLVERKTNKHDRRQVDIRITAKGIKVLEEIEKTPAPGPDSMKKFSHEKARLINEWLDELRD